MSSLPAVCMHIVEEVVRIPLYELWAMHRRTSQVDYVHVRVGATFKSSDADW